jgi:hypothetical protein
METYKQIIQSLCRYKIFLNHKHEYGSVQNITQLIKTSNKVRRMNCIGNFYIQQFKFQGPFSDEQTVGEMNPLFVLTQKTDAKHASAQIIYSTQTRPRNTR